MEMKKMQEQKKGRWGYLGIGIVILIIGINIHYSTLSVHISQNCQRMADGSTVCLVQLTNVSGTSGSLLIRSSDLYWQATTADQGVVLQPFHGYLGQGDISDPITITAPAGICPFHVVFSNNDGELAHLDYVQCDKFSDIPGR